MKLYLLSLTLCISLFSNSQAPLIEWEKSYGGSNNDFASCIIPTKDSGYIIAGGSFSTDGDVTDNHGNADYWVVKVNNGGTIEWEKTYGGSGDDEAVSIVQTKDGGYAVAGLSNSIDGDVTGNHGSYDFWVIKLDSVGDLIWEQSYGGSNVEQAYSIIQTKDGGYAVCGEDSSFNDEVTGDHGGYDFWVIKLDSVGDLLWEKSLGGSGFDQASQIIQTADRGYAVAGVSGSNDGDVTGNHGNEDYWVVKLDSVGNIVWEQSYGGSNEDGATSIIQTVEGGYALSGITASDDGNVTNNFGDYDYWVVKIDSVGTLLWQKSYGGSGMDIAYPIISIQNGDYVIAGYSNSNDSEVTGNHGSFDYWIINIDSVGDLIWEESLGGSHDDYASSILQTTDGSGYMIAGLSNSNDGDVTGNHGENDYWIVKLSTITGMQKVDEQIPALVTYPNPASGFIIVQYENYQPCMSLAVYNCLGQAIKQQPLRGANQQIDVSHLAAGLYMVCIKQNEEIVAGGKFVKE